ncbi:MAG: hypothetical protein WC861_05195 [Candidatus Micrarchaeia archaeon]|jgi:hypothetical protein
MKFLIGLVVACLLAGSLFAISGAATSGIGQQRWSGTVTAGSAPTQGGNITTLSITTTQLTSKWASFNGNVSGTIRLSDTQAGSAVYVWTYSAANGGEVCTSTSSTFPSGTPTNASSFTNFDTVFATTGGPDNASGTFNTTCPTLTISSGALTNFIAARTQGSSTFTTCAMNASGSAAANHAFCTNVAATGTGKNYNNVNANFELIVPSTATAGGTYYFYMELN